MASGRFPNSNHSNQPHISRGTYYSRAATNNVRPRPTIDGIGERRKIYVPANQDEYLDSLAGAPPKLSRYSRQQATQSINSDFGPKVNRLLNSAGPRLKNVRPFLPAIGIALILLVSIVSLGSVRSAEPAGANRSKSRSSVETSIDTSDEISERRPTNMQSYQVSGDLPRMLYVDDMGLSARIRRVGVGTDTEIRLPSNIYDVGWYESSVKPGEQGAVVLTGHATGPTKPGIFHDLTEFSPGDEFEIETGAGDRYTYYVAKLEAYRDNDPLDPMLAPAIPGIPGLNLITETGHYDTKSNTFDQRLVIYAVQKGITKNPKALTGQ